MDKCTKAYGYYSCSHLKIRGLAHAAYKEKAPGLLQADPDLDGGEAADASALGPEGEEAVRESSRVEPGARRHARDARGAPRLRRGLRAAWAPSPGAAGHEGS